MGKKILMKGNEAIAEAAIRAGCQAYFGYPITPQTELLEYMAKHLPERGGIFIQAESEIIAISMVYGAAASGVRVMTSSSSPGISLKQEGISYLAMAKLPCVIVNMMRGGPGLGAIQPSQADYFQATRGGGHGDYRTIVLAPSTTQEAVNLVPLAFDLADKYRIPVVFLGDGAQGQISEPVEFKPYQKLSLPPKDWILTGCQDRSERLIVPYHFDQKIVEEMNCDLAKTYEMIKGLEVRYELLNYENPDIFIVAFGLMARISKTVIKEAEKEGIKVGLIRPITLWPFPSRIIRELAEQFKKDFLVVEMNQGQMIDDVNLAVQGRSEVHFYGRAGGVIPVADEIMDEIRGILGRERKMPLLTDCQNCPDCEEKETEAGFKTLNGTPFFYCPGCGHGVVHKILAEVIDELGIREKTIGVFPVGCSVAGPSYFRIDSIIPPHGRPPAAATGIKRVQPDKIVFVYQGDGDLAAIGLAETVHTANRGENVTVIFINNAVYGMTGGQMAPTTLIGQKTTTSLQGRNPETEGYPIRVCELLSVLEKPAYLARVTVTSPKEVLKAKAAIKKALQYQIEGKGYSLVEVLSPCPINWKLSPRDAHQWLEKEMTTVFPLGTFRDKFAGGKSCTRN